MKWKLIDHDPYIGVVSYEFEGNFIKITYTWEPYFRPEQVKIREIELTMKSDADKFEMAEPLYCSSFRELNKILRLNDLPLIDVDAVWAEILTP